MMVSTNLLRGEEITANRREVSSKRCIIDLLMIVWDVSRRSRMGRTTVLVKPLCVDSTM